MVTISRTSITARFIAALVLSLAFLLPAAAASADSPVAPRMIETIQPAAPAMSVAKINFVPPNAEIAKTCCKVCSKGKPCGNSCISRDKTCHKAPGCACAAR